MANGTGANGDNILVGSLQLDLGQLKQNVDDANALLNSIGKDASKHIKTLTQTYTNLSKSIAKGAKAAAQAWKANPADANSADLMKRTAAAQRELKTSQSEYMIALKTGNSAQQRYWSDRNAEIHKEISNLDAEASALAQNDKLRNQIVDTINRAKNAQEGFNQKNRAFNMPDYLKKAKDAYGDLNTAITQQNKAVEAGDEASASYWQTRKDAANAELSSIENSISSLNLDKNVREKILDIIQKSRDAQRVLNVETEEGRNIVDGLATGFDKVKQVLQIITGLSLAKMFSDAVRYAKEFDRAIVDIAVVTQQSVENTREMGTMYRELANDLNVTSVDLATAAATIYRQGYSSDREVSDIITGATKFGAVSGLSTAESIDAMTASLQNFREETESAQEVVEKIGDTWSYMGDAVATEGADIADAMGKAAASVASVGLEFEKASAYAAVMLSRTQQTGDVIGTQLNSLASRYAKITSTGYKKVTSDDEGEALSFNDVSKALKTVGIEMYDTINKTFIPLSKVLDDLGPKWNSLDEATQKYIATSMAGTRGMNYFLTLMQNYDEALSLQQQAMDNRGVVNEKYLIWMQGVEAAQNNLTNSMEQFYSVLSANTLTDFYNGAAGVVDFINAATEATDGLNIKIPVTVAGLLGVVSVIAKITTAIKAMREALDGTEKMFNIGKLLSSNVGLIVAGVTLIGTVIGGVVHSIQNDLKELNEEIRSNQESINQYYVLSDSIENLSKSTQGTAEYHAEFNRIRKEIVADSPSLQAVYGKEGEKIASLGEAADIAADKIDNLQAAQKLLLSEAQEGNKKKFADDLNSYLGGENFISLDDIISRLRETSLIGYDFKQNLYAWMGNVKSLGIDELGYNDLLAQKEEIEKIFTSADYLDLDIGEEAVKELDEFYQTIIWTMEVRASEINEQKDALSDILFGLVYSDGIYTKAFAGHASKLNDVISDFLKINILGMQEEEIEGYFRQYIEVMISTLDKVWNASEYNDANAILPDMINAGVDTSDLEEYINEYKQAYEMASRFAYFTNFGEALSSGKFSVDEIKAFNAAIADMDDQQAITFMQAMAISVEAAFSTLGVAIQKAEEKIQSFDTTSIYENLAIAKQEANGFIDVLSKLGEGEGLYSNIHEAVLAMAQEMAFGLGISDKETISKIAESLLSGLYDMYPDLVDWVDGTSGILLDGWQDGIKEATNIWSDAIEKMRIDTALKNAKEDMSMMADSALWNDLLSPEGIGLYEYADNWAKALIPDGTIDEVHQLASQFVDLFFDMFADIDASIIDADGKIIPGMEALVEGIRKAVHESEIELSKLAKAYGEVNSDRIGRENAVVGLNNMLDANRNGDSAGVLAEFEKISDTGISAILDVMPELITKLNEGTYSVHDLYEAIYRLNEAAYANGKDAWKAYFDTQNPSEASETLAAAMRYVVREVSQANDKFTAFYSSLQKLSDRGVDITKLLDQYGSLGESLLSGKLSADELYEAINRIVNIQDLQIQIEELESLSSALETIDPMSDSYSSKDAFEAYSLLEGEYEELAGMERGSIEYLKTAKELIDQSTKSVYEQANAYGVVLDAQAESARQAEERITELREKMAEYALESKLEGDEDINFAGSFNLIEEALIKAKENGENIRDAWFGALEDIDDAGVLEEFVSLFGDISGVAEECGYDVGAIIAKMKELQETVGDTEKQAQSLRDIASPASVAQKALNKLASGEKLEIKLVEDLLDLFPELADEILHYAENTDEATDLIEALNKAQSDRALSEWADGLVSALKAVENATEGTYEYDKAMRSLGDVFDSGLGSFDSLAFAQQNLENIKAAANGSAEAFRALQEAAYVNIVGTSYADFSAVLNGIELVSENSIAMANWLASLGLFTVETVNTKSAQDIIDGITGEVKHVEANGVYRILKPMASNPFKAKTTGGSGSGRSSGSGGGGGGGGSSSVSVSEKTEKMLSGMDKANEAFENRKTIMELRKEYHDIRGEIQGVIAYTEEEAKIIEEQNGILEQNLAKLEAEIKSKEAILASNKSSSKAYKQAAVDLEELNERHKEYTQALLENKNRLEEIREELEEFAEEARQATIGVQDLIRETLEAQEERQRDMLDATVDLEDEILEILAARYEKEQELAIEAAEARKEAIQEEIDAIDELISAREKLINKEKEELEISELEAKIARISADPTRRKELLELQAELAELREEQAWNSYKEELEAQQESLEDQITNLDDYIDYVNDYYEELFENPQRLIAEMQEIMQKTDEEIIAWLSANQEEFASYSAKKKEQTIQDWQDMIDAMRGVTETYSDEIEEIMSWTDEEIMEWLKENNIEFQNATAEQQESFLYTWKKTLEAWRDAYKEVSADVSSATYTSGDTGGSGGSSGGGSGGSSGGGAGGASTPKSYSGKAAFQYKVHGGGWSSNYSSTATSTMSQANATLLAATSALNKVKSAASTHYKEAYANSTTGRTKMLGLINDASVNNPGKLLKRVYKTGGMVYETGLAWLDGTKSKPERVLSAYQTQLFEDLIATLHTIKTLNVGGIASVQTPNIRGGASSFVIENISVIVEGLNNDSDYELMAAKVGDVLKKEVLKLMPSGGIII